MFPMHQEMYSVQNTDELIECDIVFQTTNKSDINGPEAWRDMPENLPGWILTGMLNLY